MFWAAFSSHAYNVIISNTFFFILNILLFVSVTTSRFRKSGTPIGCTKYPSICIVWICITRRVDTPQSGNFNLKRIISSKPPILKFCNKEFVTNVYIPECLLEFFAINYSYPYKFTQTDQICM